VEGAIEASGPRAAGAESSDAELRRLLAELSAGRRAALGDLYDRLHSELFAVALWRAGARELAEEAVQEVFARLAASRADLVGVRAPRTYLLAIAHRAALDVARRERRRREVPLEEALIEPVAPSAEARADARRLSALLLRLPAAQRVAVTLRHQLGLSFAEIGRVTGTSLFTAASRCRLGIARLRRWMKVRPS
jgi:RNA polymerase sigma-70 factor (ECF subfamily)